MTLEELEIMVRAGESDRVELKRSTGQLSRAGETLSAFLNGTGGMIVFGVTPEGEISGQQVSEHTLRDVASMVQRVEPRAPVDDPLHPR